MINLKNVKNLLTVNLFLFLFLGSVTAQESVGTVDLTVETFDEFDVFGDTLDNYSVFFTGENHVYTTFNTDLQFKLLKYLHQKQNVKHFIFEQSPGLSYILNKIVLEDKTTHLHFLKEMFFEPFYELVKDLRDFNENLTDEEKIKVHGIDIERFPSFSVYALNEMVEDLDRRSTGGEVFEQIKALATSQFKDAGPSAFYADNESAIFQFGQVSAWSSLSSIIEGSKTFEDSLKVTLGKDSTIFYSIIESLEIGHEWYLTEQDGDVKSPIIRERFMADEFERIYKQDSESKYYGQFGRCHLHKEQKANNCYDYYMNSIANRINDIDPKLENQVLVIPIFYSNSKDMDKDIIESLELDERFTNSKETYIIDLAYKNGDHSIMGFYNHLPFVIVSNATKDEVNVYDYAWDNTLIEYHLGAAIGYTYFRKIPQLNNALMDIGAGGFDTRRIMYSFSGDYFTVGETGASYSVVYYPPVSNGDRFQMKGFNFTGGSNYSFGGPFVLGVVGFDMGYGQIKLVEEQENNTPSNLIQSNGTNKVVYRNDIFTLDPSMQMRITLPVISLNVKAGYAFDISGKYWRLDGKEKDFTKTSFSAPYVQVGASLNFKTR